MERIQSSEAIMLCMKSAKCFCNICWGKSSNDVDAAPHHICMPMNGMHHQFRILFWECIPGAAFTTSWKVHFAQTVQFNTNTYSPPHAWGPSPAPHWLPPLPSLLSTALPRHTPGWSGAAACILPVGGVTMATASAAHCSRTQWRSEENGSLLAVTCHVPRSLLSCRM